jgi:hypothetical protein
MLRFTRIVEFLTRVLGISTSTVSFAAELEDEMRRTLLKPDHQYGTALVIIKW